MATQVANKLKYLLTVKAIDFANDAFKIILMGTGFIFDRDLHHVYADVSASELATGYGYTIKTKALAGVAITEDDAVDYTKVNWNNVSWTASGGTIGPSPGAIIIDDTVSSPVVDPIIGYIDFGGDQSQVDGGIASIVNIELRIA
jgi:hypothetical protein